MGMRPLAEEQCKPVRQRDRLRRREPQRRRRAQPSASRFAMAVALIASAPAPCADCGAGGVATGGTGARACRDRVQHDARIPGELVPRKSLYVRGRHTPVPFDVLLQVVGCPEKMVVGIQPVRHAGPLEAADDVGSIVLRACSTSRAGGGVARTPQFLVDAILELVDGVSGSRRRLDLESTQDQRVLAAR